MVTVLVSAIRFMTGPSCAEAVHERAPSAAVTIKAKRARFIKMPSFSRRRPQLDTKNRPLRKARSSLAQRQRRETCMKLRAAATTFKDRFAGECRRNRQASGRLL